MSYVDFGGKAGSLRQSGDYDDLYDATKDEVYPYIQKIFEFISRMEELINIVE